MRLLPHIPNPFAPLGHLTSIAEATRSMARDTSRLPDLHDRLEAIERHLASVDDEVALMRARVDVMAGDVAALKVLEDQLEKVRSAVAPLERLGGRRARRAAARAVDPELA